MRTCKKLLFVVAIAAFLLNFGSPPTLAGSPPLPVVAIHVSELTQALETIPATPPTPTGAGNTGYEWWYTSWHYFVMHESLEEALRSDGTPYVVVSDADIAAGVLLNGDGSPKYPIVISLASEAIGDNEVGPLRSYVSAGGFLFVGSSAFTRNPAGTTRFDFALASEMGLHMVNSSLSNWAESASFSKVLDHRLVSHIPSGSLIWHMPLTAEQIPWGTTAGHSVHTNHYVWQVVASNAEVIANGSAGPLLATKGYGQGRFIYHGAMQPLIGVGGYDDGMYSYVIYRRAIEWAFEAANVPIVRLSPWRYPYDAAFVVRHDFENFGGAILGIEASASFENTVGAKGDYFFCTGTLRPGSEDTQLDEASKAAGIESLGRAVSLYGATIGSHNGGLANPVNPGMASGSYDYWHWGPDEALDTTPAGYANGKAYAQASIGASFTDIEGWLAGLDNGRSGCGALANCPRIWVSPYFNSAREDSLDVFEQLGVSTVGEQKCGPFPHWTVSTRTLGKRYPHLSLPVSDWYVGNEIAQALDYHNSSSMRAGVDFYYGIGALVNMYMHNPSNGGLPAEYVTYNLSKPNMWAANAVGVYDWWQKRAGVTVTPGYSQSGGLGIVNATISGATDPETAVEVVVPNWASGAVGNVQVLFNGSSANPANYRLTSYGVKAKVGTTVSSVGVRYTPLETWTQSDWIGGAGQATWSDDTRFASSTGIDVSNVGQARLSIGSGGDALFSDDFTRTTPGPSPFTWTVPTPTPAGSGGQFNTTGGVLDSSTTSSGLYGFAYPALDLGDGSVEADIQFASGAFGGGLMARVNTVTGQRYGAWIYPDASGNVLRMIRFSSWTGSWTALQQVSLASVGTGWHHLKITLTGGRIQVYYDNATTPVIDVTDGSPLPSGPTGIDFWTTGNTIGPTLNNYVVRDGSNAVVFSDNFGADSTDSLPPWSRQLGTWSVANGVLQGASVAGEYGFAYYGAPWTNYTVEGRLQLPAGAFAGGIGGRLDAATGAHYAAWVYPDGSSGGSNVLKLIKYRDWTNWSGTPMQQVTLSSVGTAWHTIKMAFDDNRIRVWYDGNQVVDVTDTGFDGRAAYPSGGVTVDTWESSSSYTVNFDDIVVRSPAAYGASGTLLSSAFDGGVGAQWETIAWDAAAGGTTGAGIRTRTADRADQLTSASWSDYYATSGSAVTSANKRWMQYELELTSTDPAATPNFYELRVTYVPGIQLPGSNLTYTGPTASDSQSDVTFAATLLDDGGGPIAGRSVTFTLDGMGVISGTTNGAGQASVPAHLSLAPGQYTLQVAFAGDASYAPVSTSLPFTVASPWSVWIQDTQADFQGNTPTDVDTDAAPGSVRLRQSFVGAGEEAGSFSVSSETGWGYRRGLFLDNSNSSDLRSGYSVELVLDTASFVGAGKLRADGNDLRVVWDDGATQVELDRLAETPFNTSDTEIWFKTRASIPAGGRDAHYFIYYGNPAASTPPADPRNVWALWDGFDGSSVDTSLWVPNGPVTVGGGQAHFGAGGNLFGRTAYSDARFEVRLRMSAQNLASSAWWGWEETASDAPNILVFEEVSTGLQGLMRKAGGAYEWIDMTAPARTDWHTYGLRWWSGNAVWLIDGSPTLTRSTGVPTVSQFPNMNAPGVSYDVEYVKARLDAAADPTVTPASPQPGYASEGRMLSIAHDTGQLSVWKYLTWDSVTPSGTAVTLRARTAASEAELTSAPWADYAQSGLLMSNAAGRWVQYEAILTTSDATVTPELRKVTVYYGASPCTPDVACSTGQLGVCEAGTVRCDTGSPVCQRNVGPSLETCNGLDDDCDGVVDDGDPGGGAACATGQPGVCAAGTMHCVGGALVCQRNTSPSTEVCDGLDNDCNGTVDDGITATTVIPSNLAGIPGQTIVVPVQLGDVAGRGVYAGEMDVRFDPTVLSALSVAQGAALTGKSCTLTENLNTSGRILVDVFCTLPLTGNAPLVNVSFQVTNGLYGRSTALTFARAQLNEGCPAVTAAPGSFIVRGPEICDGQDNDGIGGIDEICTVSGAVHYYRDDLTSSEPSDKPVPNVGIDLSGTVPSQTTTDGNGAYLFGGLHGSVTVAPMQKSGDRKGAISSMDAAAVAMAAVGNGSLSANQFIAGDVTGNHTISALDASYIARLSVGLVTEFPVAMTTGSDWMFLKCVPDYAGTCGDPTYTIDPITGPQTANDFYAILYGDVTGNWPQAGTFASSRTAISPEENDAVVRDLELADRFRNEGPPPVIERRPGSAPAELSLSGWKPLRAGEQTRLSVNLLNADGILGLDLVLRYDPSRIAIISTQTTGIGSNLSLASARGYDTLRVAAYGDTALTGSGAILTFTIEGLKNTGRQAPPTIGGVANEGGIPLRVRERGLTPPVRR